MKGIKHPWLYITFAILLILVLYIHNSLKPAFFSLAEVEAVRIANRAINEAVDKEVENINYRDLIKYEVDSSGNIVLMQPNIREINKFSSRMSLDIQSELEQISRVTVAVPLFKVLGLELIAGLGPDLNVQVVPAGFTHPPKINDSFEAAGINQTRHKIYLDVDVTLYLIIPFYKKSTTIEADVPIIEVTILGKVPEIYVGLSEDNISGIIGEK